MVGAGIGENRVKSEIPLIGEVVPIAVDALVYIGGISGHAERNEYIVRIGRNKASAKVK